MHSLDQGVRNSIQIEYLFLMASQVGYKMYVCLNYFSWEGKEHIPNAKTLVMFTIIKLSIV